MDFGSGLPKNSYGNMGIVIFNDHLIKISHLAAVRNFIDGEGNASMFIDQVFRQHGLTVAIITKRDPRFTKTTLKVCRQSARHTIEHVHIESSAN